MREGVMMSLVLSLFVVVPAVVPAAAQDRLDAVAAAVDRALAPASAEAAAVVRMAAFLGTGPDVLRAERAGTQLGWGDLFVSHRIATRGAHPIEQVFAARRSGAPWGAIAEEARVEVETLVQDVAALWPEAARARSGGETAPAAPAPPATPEPPRGLGSRVLDVLRGAPADTSGERARDEPPVDRTPDEIRERMIRGGGARTR
jgi:hypothetical protein